MLRLLLDEHISPTIARQLSARRAEIEVTSVQQWDGGAHLGLPDEQLLALAHSQHWTLVTYDQRTIVPLLKNWGEMGIPHSGVVFVDEKTVAPNDFGGLVRAMSALFDAYGQEDWTDWIIYLTPAR